jgi:hypothetical protein
MPLSLFVELLPFLHATECFLSLHDAQSTAFALRAGQNPRGTGYKLADGLTGKHLHRDVGQLSGSGNLLFEQAGGLATSYPAFVCCDQAAGLRFNGLYVRLYCTPGCHIDHLDTEPNQSETPSHDENPIIVRGKCDRTLSG